MKVNRCKGCRDLGPEQMDRFRFIENEFRDSCLKWGYREVRTPTLEYLHLFTSAGTLTPSMLSRVYSFLDWDGWSGERVVLRPDGTIPVARLYSENMAESDLAKLFYVANMFAFEGSGVETREKWQCGAELIGGQSPIADVEIISLATEVLEKLELSSVGLKLSHAGLIKAILGKIILTAEDRTALFDRILDGDAGALTGIHFETPGLSQVLPLLVEMKGKSAGFLKNLKSIFARELSGAGPVLDDFISIGERLEALGGRFEIDLEAGRGFEYYTGIMFRLEVNNEIIGGGGRYDALIPLVGGKNIPACGFALYLDKLIRAITHPPEKRPHILVRVSNNPEMLKKGFGAARELRQAGYIAQVKQGDIEPAECGWLLDIRRRAPRLVLTDRRKKTKSQPATLEEVRAIIGH